ncbi:unnamed protein product [Phytophthora fragariaefolia]|uniref:Unnamed protein product n=1 Tax=Phytophthora fragariaefolia TaxID=1490495 RepID=A0A9W6Y8F7_9STRA|nr:unnamed protein product [Phytophthora fragariaefolia]
MEVMAKIFGLNEDVVVIDPGNRGIVVWGMTTIPDEMIANILASVFYERILIPMRCNGNLWCAIVVDLQADEIRRNDPMMSSSGGPNTPAVSATPRGALQSKSLCY